MMPLYSSINLWTQGKIKQISFGDAKNTCSYPSQALLCLTQVATINNSAQRIGTSIFQRPLRSNCIDIAKSSAPSINRAYNHK